MDKARMKELEGIISETEFVLSSSERNENGNWIGNEHALLQWSKRIRMFIGGMNSEYSSIAAIEELLKLGMAHPCEVEKMRRLLEYLLEEDKREK